MAYAPHVLVAFGGTLGTPSLEVWTCSLKLVSQFGAVDTMTEAEQLEYATAAVTPISTWMSDSSSSISSTAKLTFVKVNSITELGRYLYDTTTDVEVSPAVGGGSTNGVQWRQTQAVTLRAAFSRGPAAIGRFYPPAVTAQPPPGDPYIATTPANSMLTTATTLINALNAITTDAGAHSWQVANVSRSNAATGPVRLVEIDRVPDTQRRRTNRVPRLSVSAPITL